jgi:hypothetical protein
VTNDPALSGWEYAQRMWIEQAFRDLKSHGWQVESACVSDPQRMARLWILLVVAYAWMLLLGTACIAAGRGAAKNVVLTHVCASLERFSGRATRLLPPLPSEVTVAPSAFSLRERGLGEG